jgi:hypothetical protein
MPVTRRKADDAPAWTRGGRGKCQCCWSPNRAQIELAIAMRVSTKAIAQGTGVSTDSITRHRRRHMPPQLIAALQSAGTPTSVDLDKLRKVEGEKLLQTVVWQRSALYTIEEMARVSGDTTGALRAHGAITRNLELSGKLLGELNAAAKITNNINNFTISPDYIKVYSGKTSSSQPLDDAQEVGSIASGNQYVAISGH